MSWFPPSTSPAASPMRIDRNLYWPMALRFDEVKTTQAAARLVSRDGGRMKVRKLVTLLYLTDRQALSRWGRPLTFDAYFSLPQGPIPSATLDKINESVAPEGPSYWHTFISERSSHSVALLWSDPPPHTELSLVEEELLDQIWEEFGDKSGWELCDYSRSLPEWQDPERSRRPIHVQDILMSEGFSRDTALAIKCTLGAESDFAQRFGALSTPPVEEPYRLPDLSCGNPCADDPLAAYSWRELSKLIYERRRER